MIKTTNTLKGIAISSILINHYLNMNVAGDSTGFANAWIAIFFFLSGYGIFLSLKDFSFTRKELLFFYYKRVIRIFPLLWLAWAVQFIVQKEKLSFWILTGIHAQGHYWFIPSILQCYLVSPFLYLAIRKKPIISSILIALTIAVLNYLLYAGYNDPLQKLLIFIHAKWRHIYFLNIIVFSLGMLLAKNIQNIKYSKQKNIITWCFILAIIIMMICLKKYSHIYQLAEVSFAILPVIAIILLCVFSLKTNFRNVFFEYSGSISYSIYLFHMSFYLILNRFTNDSFSRLQVTLLCFPIFILICTLLENTGNIFNKQLRRLISQ